MRRILIAGAGYVGAEVAGLLQRQGDQVFALSRSGKRLPPGVTSTLGDLTVPGSLADLPKAIDAIVYCPAPDRGDEAGYQSLYVDGLSHLLGHFEGREIPRLLFVSSTAVYAQADGGWVDEDSETSPSAYNGLLMLKAEQLALARSSRSTVLRLGGIYGPGRDRLIRMVGDGTATYDPERPRYTNRIHRRDAAGIIVHLLASEPPPAIYLGVDHEPAPYEEVVKWLALKLGAPEPPARSEEPGGRKANNKRCSNRRILRTGYRFHYPTYRDGYSAMLAGS